jgi:lipase ATG15
VQVTGHSLGGGLSIITGAQARIPAVALSGPNALISGRSFDPPVTPDMLNRYTFNIIPNRDVVPLLDDVADQLQYIRCNTEMNDFVGCHDSTRSLCEIIHTCGTGPRPAICECTTLYGYPKPVTLGNRTFDEVCSTN